jgi:hypothetical protein
MGTEHVSPDPRHQLASTTAAAWDRYRTLCITNALEERRASALEAAVSADDRLAEHDRTTRAQAKTEELRVA